MHAHSVTDIHSNVNKAGDNNKNNTPCYNNGFYD